MATSAVPSLSCGTLAEDVFKMMVTCQSTALVRGTVACLKTTGSDLDVVDPDTAGAGPVFGLVLSAGTLTSGSYSAPAVGDPLVVQRFGRGVGLLGTSQTITKGDPLGAVVGGAGTLGLYAPGQGMKYVGIAAQSKTTTGATRAIEVDLNCNPRSIHSQSVMGAASTTSQNNTRYLSAPGTTTPASAAVVLAVVPPGGGYIRNLVASATTAPANADTDQFIVYRNPLVSGAYTGWATTTLTCTITGTAVEAKDATHAVAVTEGDLLAIGVVASATSAGAARAASFQITQLL